ncbi:MAG TPA: M56 family metallopeptidase [Candidatus Solibacter sp.]|nr:M56 family metallopeptidase [Candidatus Solibacter sp.]
MILTALAHHLLQSTLFAAAAALLALTLRLQRARLLYGVWLAASLKFLVPFSGMVRIGGYLAPTHAFDGATRLHFAVRVVSGVASATALSACARWLPEMIAVWLAGSIVIATTRAIEWRKMYRAARSASELLNGRELEALRRVERLMGKRAATRLLLSKAALEPGVFGIVRPVLLWPSGISDRLSEAQLESILAHELEHILRRDNLSAALHMLVQIIFWFHPLVWWLGARLATDRERACDEAVLALRWRPQAYAEGILKVCEFCLDSPLAGTAGVAGGDLKKRMVYIMTERVPHPLDFTRKLLLTLAGAAAISSPIAYGLINATQGNAGQPEAIAGTAQAENPDRQQVSRDEMRSHIVKKVNPQYPDAARKAGIEGDVVLRAIVGKSGDVENLQIVSGHPQLAPAAIEAVKQWKYKPYLKNGEPVEVQTDITVSFTLAK